MKSLFTAVFAAILIMGTGPLALASDSAKEAKDSLQKSFEEIAKAGPVPGASPGGDEPGAAEANEEADKEDDIVDADFEVVDDEKGKS